MSIFMTQAGSCNNLSANRRAGPAVRLWFMPSKDPEALLTSIGSER